MIRIGSKTCDLDVQRVRRERRNHIQTVKRELNKDIFRGPLASGSTLGAREIARFDERSREWWNPRGKFSIIQKFNAVRLEYIIAAIAHRFRRDTEDIDELAGLNLLDIGCGAGVLTEPLAKGGAIVVATDRNAASIDVARRHSLSSGLNFDYRHCLAAAPLETGHTFDVVLNTEVVEHVADQGVLLRQSAALKAPGGLHLVATLNRTAKAWLLAIVGAEYVLGWLPNGTHAWSKFVRPSEARTVLTAGGLAEIEIVGVGYDTLRRRWGQCPNVSVNYMMLSERPAASVGGTRMTDKD